MNKSFHSLLIIVFTMALASCTSTKFVPDGSYLLDEVKVRSNNKNISSSDLRTYVRQNPNAKWFSLVKTQLYVYNFSGRDSTKWINKFWRRIGDAPIIYNEADAVRSREEIQKAVQNMGFMSASVNLTTKKKKKKIKVYYDVNSGPSYIVTSFQYDIPDPNIEAILQKDSAKYKLRSGMIFDVNKLDAERQSITDRLLQNGYYKFNKDYIGYTADTTKNSYLIDLTMHLKPYQVNSTDSSEIHKQFYINNIKFITDFDMLQTSALNSVNISDSIQYKGYPIYYNDKMYLRPKVLIDNLRFAPGDLYDERNVQQTYSNFGRMSALKYTNIRFIETQKNDSSLLDCFVMLTKSKDKSVSFEVEGTNSAGDLGAAASVSFQNRNLFHGSESFMIKFRGAYEVISGLQPGYANSNYTELGVESSINFPSFMFPFLSSNFKRKIRATTEFGLQYNYQKRPEFIRTMASASWSYKWSQHQKVQHRIDLLNIGFLYLPKISERFKEDFINKGQSHIFQYNYQNRLIINMGYNYYYNSAGGAPSNTLLTANSYAIRVNFESAGNGMYLLAKAIKMHKNKNDEYAIWSIPFAQYLKGEFDYSKNVSIDERNSFAFHVGIGIAFPYGNAKTIPFEKQYFSGGANSVRGWAVRELGPGSFKEGQYTNLLDQSGDIKFDANVEYRTKLFWKFRGAVFVDAGNIWTIRDYENQPGGVFKFNKFYKQIAVAYGLGLRIDLNFFILRFDGGMKAINPVYESGRDRYPIIHPKLSRDFAFHFAVGYPF